MKFAKGLACLMLLASWAIQLQAAVTVQVAKTVDFAQYKTFAWRQGTPAADPAIEKMIRDAIQKQLLAKGLTRVDTDADLLVSTHAKQESEMREDVDILGASQRWTGESEQDGVSGDTLRPVDVGTLVVDLLDGSSRLNIWRGTATRTLSDSPKTAQKQIEKAVKKMFESFLGKAE
jgi:hypothetical protein